MGGDAMRLALGRSKARVRYAAATCLGALGPSAGGDVAIELLRSTGWKTQCKALRLKCFETIQTLENPAWIVVTCEASEGASLWDFSVTCIGLTGSELAVIACSPCTIVKDFKNTLATCINVKSYLLQLLGPTGILSDSNVMRELISVDDGVLDGRDGTVFMLP